MLAEMLEMLGPDAGAIEMLAIEIECSEQQMSADVTGRAVGLGRCYWQMLTLTDVVGRQCWPGRCCWQMLLAEWCSV